VTVTAGAEHLDEMPLPYAYRRGVRFLAGMCAEDSEERYAGIESGRGSREKQMVLDGKKR
jgi:hypothetical protein